MKSIINHQVIYGQPHPASLPAPCVVSPRAKGPVAGGEHPIDAMAREFARAATPLWEKADHVVWCDDGGMDYPDEDRVEKMAARVIRFCLQRGLPSFSLGGVQVEIENGVVSLSYAKYVLSRDLKCRPS